MGKWMVINHIGFMEKLFHSFFHSCRAVLKVLVPFALRILSLSPLFDLLGLEVGVSRRDPKAWGPLIERLIE